MFDRFRKKSPALQLYGKLPIAKDYLRVGASKGPALQLREWLDHAYSSRASSESRAPLAGPMRFILGAVAGEPLVGCAWPSTDLGGNRPFPFVAFAEHRRRSLAQSEEEDFLRLPMIWDALEACYAGHTSYADGQEFLTAMRTQEVELGVPLGPTPPRVPWQAWVHAIWPEEGQEGLVKTLLRLGALRSEGPVPVRLPLVEGVDELSQVHVWWSTLVAVGLLKSGEVPSCFLPAPSSGPEQVQAGSSFCSFFRSPLDIESARWLARVESSDGLGPGDFTPLRPCRLGPLGPVPESIPSLADSMRGPLATVRARL